MLMRKVRGRPQSAPSARMSNDVRYWPKADIPSCTAHVQFWR